MKDIGDSHAKAPDEFQPFKGGLLFETTMKQTAVEWLISRFESGDMYNVEDAQFIKHHAKQMEKEQMQNLIIWMYKVSADQPMRFETDIDDIVEQYYNETYGKETDCH